jgi:mannose/cellobiose epimerase-like protein (N-acyl-D-glucosamine 2-epimerase family)
VPARTFRESWALRQQINSVLGFHYPECIDHRYGGYCLNRDEREGYIYERRGKHLVGTCRMVYTFCVGARFDGPEWCRSAATHGLTFLFDAFRDDDRGGFDWLLRGRETVDDTRRCYGHAFSLLACAAATEIGLPRASDRLEQVASLLDERFFEPEYGLHRAEADGDWSFSNYRGQNANMHACEAYLAAFDATNESDYLDRAYTVAESLVRDPPAGGGLIPEHYTREWKPDLEYNQAEPNHQFRPPGFQPGHHAEWAKLLLLLADRREESWLAERARGLFDAAFEIGWDEEYGGFYYTVDADGEPIVPEKYGWPIAEGIGAAALLGREDEGSSLERYDRLWDYAREFLINEKYGIWYEKCTREGERIAPASDGPRVEPGYHPVANAAIAMAAFEDDRPRPI